MEVVKEMRLKKEYDLAAFELQMYLLYLSSKRLLCNVWPSIVIKSVLLKFEVARNF